jgi:SEC-C motif
MRSPWAATLRRFGIDDLLRRFPDLALRPQQYGRIVVAGDLCFSVDVPEFGLVEDGFSIEIYIPKNFPSALPSIFEQNGRIPKTYHKLNDGSLCLGSPLALRLKATRSKTLLAFIDTCVIPYLAGYCIYEKTGEMPFGELAHGKVGLLEEYRQLTGAASADACIGFIECLGLRRRVANKRMCPCGSGRRLGRCHNRRINPLRGVASRAWYCGAARQLKN